MRVNGGQKAMKFVRFGEAVREEQAKSWKPTTSASCCRLVALCRPLILER